MQSAEIIKKPLSTKWAVVRYGAYLPKSERGDATKVTHKALEVVTLVSQQRYEVFEWSGITDINDPRINKVATGRSFGYKVTDGTSYRVISASDFIGVYDDLAPVWKLQQEQEAKELAERAVREQAVQSARIEAEQKQTETVASATKAFELVSPHFARLVTFNIYSGVDSRTVENAQGLTDIEYYPTLRGDIRIPIEQVYELMDIIIRSQDALENYERMITASA